VQACPPPVYITRRMSGHMRSPALSPSPTTHTHATSTGSDICTWTCSTEGKKSAPTLRVRTDLQRVDDWSICPTSWGVCWCEECVGP
jgi:hypothetical protein